MNELTQDSITGSAEEANGLRRMLGFDRAGESPLSYYFGIVRRRLWLILAFIAGAVAIAIFLTLNTTPLYRATTIMEISRQAAQVVDRQDPNPGAAQGSSFEFYQTQYGLLGSRSLAETAVRKLRLADNELILGGYGGDAAQALKRPRAERIEMAVAIVQKNTLVTPVRNSGLVNLSFDSPDAVLAARVANTIAEAYIQSSLQRRYDANSYAREFLEGELAKARAALEQSEQQVVDYAGQSDIVELNQRQDEKGTVQGQTLEELNLAVLNQALAEAKARRIAAEATYEANRGRNSAGPALNDPAITQLRAQKAQLDAQYQSDLATLKPDFPSMVALRQQINSLDRAINQQSGNVNLVLRDNYQSALSQERQLDQQVQALKSSVQGLGQRRIQYNIYQRDADTNRAQYNSLLEQYKQVSVASGVGTNNIAVVDTAEPPGSPFTPDTFSNLLLAIIAGGILGVAAAFLLEQLDEAIKAPADIERALDIPILGVIPEVTMDDPVAELQDRKSPLSEAYLSVQTALRFSTTHGVPKSLAFTSANASEGKSTSAYSIASTLARGTQRVILLDADMRNPSVHKFLGVENDRGLVDLLTGSEDVSAFVRESGIPNLDIVTAGPIPPNPAELLTDERLKALLARLGEQYAYIVVDAPPVMGLSDAPLIATAVEAVAFVVTSGVTGSKSAITSIRRLQGVNANVIGAILTRFVSSETGYGYGYNYDYSYGEKSKGINLKRFGIGR